jgi:large subunit ribosomal protein L31
MKKDIHPEYHPVVFIDGDFELTSYSTLKSDKTRVIDGVEHFEVRVDVSSASHPFFTGKQRLMDTAGRIEKFNRKYKGRKTK